MHEAQGVLDTKADCAAFKSHQAAPLSFVAIAVKLKPKKFSVHATYLLDHRLCKYLHCRHALLNMWPVCYSDWFVSRTICAGERRWIWNKRMRARRDGEKDGERDSQSCESGCRGSEPKVQHHDALC